MTRKELKKMVDTVPDGMTEAEFDEVPVFICSDGNAFMMPDPSTSGYIVFGGKCNEDGSPIEDDGLPDEIPAFALIATMEEERAETEKKVHL